MQCRISCTIAKEAIFMKYGKKAVKKKQRALNARSSKWGRKIAILFLQAILILVLGLGIIGASAGIGVFKGVIATAPDMSDIDVSPSNFSTFVYDNEGKQISKLVAADSNRIMVSSEQIPMNLKNAFIAIEDSRFYSHNGIDIKGLVRAVTTAVTSGFGDVQGASTITQQLIKNSVFPNFIHEDGLLDSLKRKIQEQYLAIELEKIMDKDTILLNYLNTINLGQNTLGVQAASLRYFNKDVSELTLSECAVIAGITQNPTTYNPISRPEKNAEKREIVLNYMLEQEMITQAEFDEAMADDVYSRIQNVNAEISSNNVNSYFIDALTDQLERDLLAEGYSESQAYKLIYSGGLSIYSTMDSNIQGIVDEVFSNEENYPEKTRWLLSYALTVKKADGTFVNHSSEMFTTHFKQTNKNFNMLYASQEDAYDGIAQYIEDILEEGDEVFAESINITPQPQASITIQDQYTGYVVALYGGRGEKTASKTLNRSTDTVRQPGSTFKILAAYAPAIDCYGKTLASVYNDAPFWYTYTEEPKEVLNYTRSHSGMMTFREAIIGSINVMAVKTLTEITPQLGFDYLEEFGITSLVEMDENGYSDIQQALALGGLTDGVSNFELNAAYATIANGGVYIEPTLYTKVLDHNGNVIIDKTVPDSHRVLREQSAFLLTSAMKDVVYAAGGTGARCQLPNMVVAGKTGTTSNNKDSWFAGFTPYYTATTWVGYDNNEKMNTSSETPLSRSLWKSVMKEIHQDLENKPFDMPDDITQVTVCRESGKLPIAGLCDGTLYTEYFEKGTEPTESCDVHYAGMICSYDNLPASDGCPFCTDGVATFVPVENEALHAGSLPRDANGNIIEGATINSSNYCQHNAEFFSNPEAYTIIQNQWNELIARQQAAAGQ